MSNYLYEAVDASGSRSQGTLDVIDQHEALKRIKEMGLFPTRVWQALPRMMRSVSATRRTTSGRSRHLFNKRVKAAEVAVFTRQLATLVDVGMPLLRGLRLLQQQEENRTLKQVMGEMAMAIEGGGTLSEALAAHPKIFSPLYVSMVKAGETGGILEVVLQRQAEFMEKALKIKARVKTAMFYPVAVMVVAFAVLALLMIFIIPRFKEVFDGLLGGRPMPAFTVAVLNVSDAFRSHFVAIAIALAATVAGFKLFVRTRAGRRKFDHFKLVVPVVGKVCRRIVLGRFSRTLGTLLRSGVPVLQALTIVKETAGNLVVGDVIARIHDNVKKGGTLAEPLKESGMFPAMISGMVDVGEQSGALPDMLLKIADNSDEQTDNAVMAMTSLLEPVLIVFLAIVVGSIVIAMFLPLFVIMTDPTVTGGDSTGG